MCAHVPLAAAVAHDQDQADQGQARHPERSLVSPLSATGLGEPAWEAFYALVYVATAILVESAPRSPASGIAAGLAFAAMLPWYLFLGRPVMRLDESSWRRVAAGWRGPIYLTGLIVLFAVADHANPNGWFFAFALSSQCFQVTTPIRRAMAFVIVLNLVGGLTVVLASSTAQNIATAIGLVLFAIAFSMVYSRWTVRVIEQSRERAVLIAQLESAQAELATAYHEAGVYAERQRLAAEIHDTLAQGFLSIVTLIQAAQASRTNADPGPPDAGVSCPSTRTPVFSPEGSGLSAGGPDAPDVLGDYLELAVATARENLAEARTLVAALAPASLDDVGLAGAVARAASATGKAAEIEATCATEGTARPLPTATEVVLLRVCQEALTNVRKHAAATRVDIRLRYAASTVELTVADNGRGCTTPAATPAPNMTGANTTAEAAEAAGETGASTGFGLRGMGERLRQVGGTLTVVTAPGAGTTIRAEVPA
jgi:signal transduction histidine kinase